MILLFYLRSNRCNCQPEEEVEEEGDVAEEEAEEPGWSSLMSSLWSLFQCILPEAEEAEEEEVEEGEGEEEVQPEEEYDQVGLTGWVW